MIKTKMKFPSKRLIIADPCYIKNALELLNDKKNYTHNLLDYGVFILIDEIVNEVTITKRIEENIVKELVIEYMECNTDDLLEIEAGTFMVDSGKTVIIDVEELKSKWITEDNEHIYKLRLVGDDSEKIYDILKDKFNFVESKIDDKGRKEYIWDIGNNPTFYNKFKEEESFLKYTFNKYMRKELESRLLNNDLSRYERFITEEKLSKGNFLYHLTEFPYNSERFVNTDGLFSMNKGTDMNAYGTLSGEGDGCYRVYNYYDNRNQLVKTIIQF